MTKELTNPHAGIILKEEFLDELNLSGNALADAINVPHNRIHAIINGTRGITADTDLRLSKFFGLSEGYWMRLQMSYELRQAKRTMEKTISAISVFSRSDFEKPAKGTKRIARNSRNSRMRALRHSQNRKATA